MKITQLRRYEGESKTKAFFSIETDKGVVIRGFKLVQGTNGLFMSNPSHYSEKDQKWFDDVYIPREIKDPLEQEAIQQYNNYQSPEQNETPLPVDDVLPF